VLQECPTAILAASKAKGQIVDALSRSVGARAPAWAAGRKLHKYRLALGAICIGSQSRPDEVGYLAAKSSNTNLVSCPDHLEEGAFLPLPCRLAGCEHLWYRPFTIWPRKINSWVACPVRSKCLLLDRFPTVFPEGSGPRAGRGRMSGETSKTINHRTRRWVIFLSG
jgi:hypothetical protein